MKIAWFIRSMWRPVLVGALLAVAFYLVILAALVGVGASGCLKYMGMKDLGPATVKQLSKTGKIGWWCWPVYR